MRTLSFFLFLIISFAVWSNDLRTVGTTYTYYAGSDEGVEEARRKAFERAVSQALAAEFGMTLSQTTSSYISEDNATTDSRFISSAESEVRGEWLETIGEPAYDIAVIDNMLVVTVTVKGRARKIPADRSVFSASVLRNSTDAGAATHSFYDGDTMYLRFQAPEDGYLAVYMLDLGANTAYRILPYSLEPNSPVATVGGVAYSYFNKDEAPAATIVDELEFTCDDIVELNDVCIVFSPSPFLLPATTAGGPGEISSMSLGAFRKWLAQSRTKDSRINSKTIHLTIKNKSL